MKIYGLRKHIFSFKYEISCRRTRKDLDFLREVVDFQIELSALTGPGYG